MKHYIPASFSQGPVTSLQSMLRAIAFVEQQFPVISATGLFDEDTLEAVLRFQKQNYLPVTGIVDEETWDSIASAFINAWHRKHAEGVCVSQIVLCGKWKLFQILDSPDISRLQSHCLHFLAVILHTVVHSVN